MKIYLKNPSARDIKVSKLCAAVRSNRLNLRLTGTLHKTIEQPRRRSLRVTVQWSHTCIESRSAIIRNDRHGGSK